ncbi:MAG: endonuclease/exonuclease/phosphatase family protein [Rhodobacteraceae bacterium]|nr:endonuclease/exonuclease/phosphatase family protein [Paracoccaceae bacterium]
MQAAENQSRIRLASYNIRKCVGLDRRRAPGRILDVITSLDADIIALQEADRRLGSRPAALPRRLIERASEFEPLDIGEGPDSLGWHGNAVLVRKGTLLLATKRLILPGLEPRGAVIADLAIGAARVRLVATHLGLMRRHRILQLQAIRAAIDTLPDLPTVILGDFNEWNGDKGLDPLQDAYTIHAPGRSYHAARPVAALDRIALGRGIDLRDAGVHEAGAALRASDHLPVWADISLPAPSACG